MTEPNKHTSSIHSDCTISFNNILFSKSLNNAERFCEKNEFGLLLSCDEERDFFMSPDGKTKCANAPLLLTPIDNHQPFTFTAKTTPSFSDIFDAGALYIYADDLLWQKFAFESDDLGTPRIISVRTIGSSDDNKHDPITEKSVWLKISSDTKVIGFYFSTDQKLWNLARIYRNTYPQHIYLGISTQSPRGKGTQALFSNIDLMESSVQDFKKGI